MNFEMKQNTQELNQQLVNAVNQEFPDLGINRVIVGIPGGNPTAIFDITNQLPNQDLRTRLNRV